LLFLAYVLGFIGIPTAIIVDLMLFCVGVGARECGSYKGKEKYIHDLDG